MSSAPTSQKNLDGNSNDPVAWPRIRERLEAGISQGPRSGGPDRHTWWLSTRRPDGGPHVTAVGVMWDQGALWFTSGSGTLKARNLAADPRCALAVATDEFDLTVEGGAVLVTDRPTVERLAGIYRAGGWPAEIGEVAGGTAFTGPFSAPSAGRPPWFLYRVDLSAATALVTVEPGGATRWTF